MSDLTPPSNPPSRPATRAAGAVGREAAAREGGTAGRGGAGAPALTLPPSVAGVREGDRLSGVARQVEGRTVIETRTASFVVVAGTPPAEGAAVSLRVDQTTGSVVRATLTEAGMPEPRPVELAVVAVRQAAPEAAAVTRPLAPGDTVAAEYVAPPAKPPAADLRLPRLAPGQTISLRIVALTSPPAAAAPGAAATAAPPPTAGAGGSPVGSPLGDSAGAAPTAQARASDGRVLEGRILGSAPDGRALLHTPAGAFALGPGLTAPAGTAVTVIAEPATPASRSASMQPNAAPNTAPGTLLSPVSPGGPGLPPIVAPAGAPPTAGAAEEGRFAAAIGVPLRAVVVAPPLTPGAGGATLSAGDALVVTLRAIVPPQDTRPGAPQDVPQDDGALQPQGDPRGARPGGGPTGTEVPGATLRSNVTTGGATPGEAGAGPRPTPLPAAERAVDPPRGPLPPLASLPAGFDDPAVAPLALPGSVAALAVRGTVLGVSAGGQTLVHGPLGTLALDGAPGLPRGATVTFDVAAAARAAPAPPPMVAASAGPPPLFAEDWPSLREIMTTLQTADTAAARQFSSTLPAANGRLAATLMFFFVAVQGGVPRTWLGEAPTRALERADRRDLLERLEEEFADLHAAAQETMPGDWRTMIVPFLDGDAIRPLRLHTRGEGEEEGRRGGGSLRFVVDLTLSRLGDLQLDGLVRGGRFDMVVRSRGTLDAAMQQEVRAIFDSGLGATGLGGTLAFETATNFATPAAEAARHALAGGRMEA